MEFEEQILKAIQAAMPVHAEIQGIRGAGCVNVMVSWRLNDDPDRPNKRSKTIEITVSREAADDFANASAADQARAFARVSAFLGNCLAQFDPSHDTPRYESPPVVHWVINTDLVNG